MYSPMHVDYCWLLLHVLLLWRMALYLTVQLYSANTALINFTRGFK